MKNVMEFLREKTKWLRSALVTLILMAIVILVFIGINWWVEEQNWVDIDLTQEKLFSLSEESKDKLKSVKQDTKIIAFGMQNYNNVETFGQLYAKENPHIQYEELTDATTRPDLQLEYGLGTTTTQVIIVEAGNRKKVVTTSDLNTYDYTNYQQIDSTEQAMTNAILDVNLEKNPKVYFLTNHAEYAQYHQIATEYLKNEANDVEGLDLLVKGNVPEDCDLLVITTLKEDLTEFERDTIIAYINSGKNIMILADPNYKEVNLPNFQSILDVYGVSLSKGIVYEQDSNRMISGYANIILPTVNYSSTITQYIASDGAVAFIDSGKLDFKESEQLDEMGITVETLITAGEKAFLRTDHTQSTTNKTNKDEDASEATLGACITKQINDTTKSQLVIYANSIFASDFTVDLKSSASNTTTQVSGIGFYNNKDLIINTVSYLTQRTDNITIRKDAGVITYTATQQENTIIKIIITALPIIILIIGIIVWQVRRRKK